MSKFIDLVKSKVGCGYVLGSQGEIMTQELLDKLAHWNTPENNKIAKKWIGKQCFDCSGLGVWSLIQCGFLKPTEDFTAESMFNKECTEIKKADLLPGDCVFIRKPDGSIPHVGYYIGNGKVIEAKGTKYGVVESVLSKTDFNTYGRLKFNLEPKEMTFDEALKIYCQYVGLDYKYWSSKNGIDKYFPDLVIKTAKFLNTKGLK